MCRHWKWGGHSLTSWRGRFYLSPCLTSWLSFAAEGVREDFSFSLWGCSAKPRGLTVWLSHVSGVNSDFSITIHGPTVPPKLCVTLILITPETADTQLLTGCSSTAACESPGLTDVGRSLQARKIGEVYNQKCHHRQLFIKAHLQRPPAVVFPFVGHPIRRKQPRKKSVLGII